MRKERANEAVKRFDVERNRAQYEAAATAWRQGDAAACRDSLEKILARVPEHRESRLLMAELELEQDRPAEAVAHLREAVAKHPQDAEAAYKLALALEADHAASEALHFFHIATQLAPAEKKYSEAFEFAQQQLKTEAVTALATDEPTAPQPVVLPVVLTETIPTSAALPAPAAAPEVLAADTIAVSVPVPQHKAPHDAEFSQLLASRDALEAQAFERLLAKFLAKEPKHVEAGILQAEIDLENDRSAAARERMERMVIRHPDDAQVRRACGLVYQALGAHLIGPPPASHGPTNWGREAPPRIRR
ncbi:MAG: tetratricopeptide repeat protein [Pirellulales bacterium]